MTKVNYTAIKAALRRVEEARHECDWRSNFNKGVITGGIDMTEANAIFDVAHKTLMALVETAIGNGARLSYLMHVIRNERQAVQIVTDEIQNRELEKRYQKENRQKI